MIKLTGLPLLNGCVNSTTRQLPLSATQRFPLLSNAMPSGKDRLFWGLELPLEDRSGWPSTMLAAIPLVNGGWNSSTRLLWVSATHRSPAPSAARPQGFARPLGFGLFWPSSGLLETKSGCPRTRFALPATPLFPVVLSTENLRMRLFFMSDTQSCWTI